MEGSQSTRQGAQPQRILLWYAKWVFASYAAAFCIFLLAFIISLPFVGTQLADMFLEHRFLLFLVMVAVSPFVFRHLQ